MRQGLPPQPHTSFLPLAPGQLEEPHMELLEDVMWNIAYKWGNEARTKDPPPPQKKKGLLPTSNSWSNWKNLTRSSWKLLCKCLLTNGAGTKDSPNHPHPLPYTSFLLSTAGPTGRILHGDPGSSFVSYCLQNEARTPPMLPSYLQKPVQLEEPHMELLEVVEEELPQPLVVHDLHQHGKRLLLWHLENENTNHKLKDYQEFYLYNT